MTLADSLTPKDTEEIKPGLFLKKTGEGYRNVNPLAWNGKIRWKEQMKTVISWRFIFTMAIIIFLYWSYTHDVQAYKDFHRTVMENSVEWCNNVSLIIQEEQDYMDIEKDGEEQQDPFSLPGYN